MGKDYGQRGGLCVPVEILPLSWAFLSRLASAGAVAVESDMLLIVSLLYCAGLRGCVGVKCFV
jgi:hypothetical protein